MDHPFAPLPAIEPDSEAWWTACRDGRFEMARCRSCRWIIHPARPVCGRCRGRDVAPEALSGLATVVTYTVNHQRWMPGLEVPYAIAIVELVEQPNLRLMTNIVGCAPDDVAIGMPVKVTFRKVTRRRVAAVFEPDPASRPPLEALRTTPAEPPKRTDTTEVLARPPRRVAPEERLERHAIISGVGQSAIGRRLFRTTSTSPARRRCAPSPTPACGPTTSTASPRIPGPIRAARRASPARASYDVQDALGRRSALAPVRRRGAGADLADHPRRAGGGRRPRAATPWSTARSPRRRAAADTGRLGIGAGSHEIRGFAAFLIPFGAMSAANWLALYARRHMHEFGTTREHLGADRHRRPAATRRSTRRPSTASR